MCLCAYDSITLSTRVLTVATMYIYANHLADFLVRASIAPDQSGATLLRSLHAPHAVLLFPKANAKDAQHARESRLRERRVSSFRAL